MISKFFNFIKADIWRIRSKDLPRRKSFLIKQLRVILLALRGFDEDKCQLRASALTFFSLLSIVPVIAMGFGIAKGFANGKGEIMLGVSDLLNETVGPHYGMGPLTAHEIPGRIFFTRLQWKF